MEIQLINQVPCFYICNEAVHAILEIRFRRYITVHTGGVLYIDVEIRRDHAVAGNFRYGIGG